MANTPVNDRHRVASEGSSGDWSKIIRFCHGPWYVNPCDGELAGERGLGLAQAGAGRRARRRVITAVKILDTRGAAGRPGDMTPEWRAKSSQNPAAGPPGQAKRDTAVKIPDTLHDS